ncbi:uncharacterized protein EI97DRAFT_429172 [Westerdykella ornata]|uniref:VWFA domain-containing protein n=1 Tax=Westerdykella ornata TaxID=318751 RepID=A0A6A6JY19_WESOR|nr:uncharacterized protein EI97DRAFT_429172 [Westerdykella ornata]KAF2281104.1 hypothetical protein EI97DRAFT_429172 [Westerdykella ornata]
MQFEEEGSRIKDLRLILERVAFAATLFDADGISIRFMNTDLSGLRDNNGRPLQDGVATEAQIESIMRGVQFKGLTPMGTALKQKVIDEIVLSKAQSGQLRKPVLVIAVTDGQPAGEPQDAVFNTIRYAYDTLSRFPQYGRGALSFEFAQVGNDEAAKKFLAKLDSDPNVGPMVDCTSNFENEQEEMSRASPPVDLTPDMWIMKLLLGRENPQSRGAWRVRSTSTGLWGATSWPVWLRSTSSTAIRWSAAIWSSPSRPVSSSRAIPTPRTVPAAARGISRAAAVWRTAPAATQILAPTS